MNMVIIKGSSESAMFTVSAGGLEREGVPQERVDEVIERIRQRGAKCDPNQAPQNVVNLYQQIRAEEINRVKKGILFGAPSPFDPAIPAVSTVPFSIVAAPATSPTTTTAPQTPSITPPSAAEFLIYLLLPKATRQIVTGDLNEEYGGIFAKFGKRRADVWYWKNVLCSFGPFLLQCITRLIQLHRWMAK